MAKTHQRLRRTATQLDEGEWKVECKTDDLYTIILKINYTLYTIKLKLCTHCFYYSSSKFSKFILCHTHIQTEKISSWNGPTVHVCCFMLARASTKTFVSRVRKTAKKIIISRKIR